MARSANAIEKVAQRLGNTKAVCRKCYVHPAVIDAYLDRSLIATFKRRADQELRRSVARLPGEEAAVLALIEERLRRELRPASNRRNRMHRGR